MHSIDPSGQVKDSDDCENKARDVDGKSVDVVPLDQTAKLHFKRLVVFELLATAELQCLLGHPKAEM